MLSSVCNEGVEKNASAGGEGTRRRWSVASLCNQRNELGGVMAGTLQSTLGLSGKARRSAAFFLLSDLIGCLRGPACVCETEGEESMGAPLIRAPLTSATAF